MQNRVHASRTPTILYVDCEPMSSIGRVRLAGLRRYAAARKWRVEALEHKDCTPAKLRKALAQLRPIGCAAECWCSDTAPRPALFGKTPVIYFEPPDEPQWRGVSSIMCDNAAVGRMAFEELSSTSPPAYAVVFCHPNKRWVRERIEAFQDCCRKIGVDCSISCFPVKSGMERARLPSLMSPWAAALPHRCAVFAVNDTSALGAARALAEAGRTFPRTVTLVGADGTERPEDDNDFAEMVSTVRIDHELSGYLAARLLAGRADPSSAAAAPPAAIFPPLLIDRRKSTRGYGRREPRILEAMEVIRRKACDGLTAETLAKRFRVSRQHFSLRFKEAAGHTILDEILNVRITRATELLANTDLPVSAVADFCGFQTGWEFWNIFRKRVGMPPLHFRNLKRRG